MLSRRLLLSRRVLLSRRLLLSYLRGVEPWKLICALFVLFKLLMLGRSRRRRWERDDLESTSDEQQEYSISRSSRNKVISCKAALYRGGDFEVEMVQVLPPRYGEIRVKVMYTSLCECDRVAMGENSDSMLLGHQATGLVESIGKNCDDDLVTVGDWVLISGHPCCKRCENCRDPHVIGGGCCNVRPDRCSGIHFFGKPVRQFRQEVSTFAEYVVVHQDFVTKIDGPSVSPLLGCELGQVLGAVVNVAKVRRGASCGIFSSSTSPSCTRKVDLLQQAIQHVGAFTFPSPISTADTPVFFDYVFVLDANALEKAIVHCHRYRGQVICMFNSRETPCPIPVVNTIQIKGAFWGCKSIHEFEQHNVVLGATNDKFVSLDQVKSGKILKLF